MIKERVFPLHFTIIVKEAFNLTRLKMQGFRSMHRFFVGNKLSESTFFDWRGVRNSTVQGDVILTGGKCT